MKLANLSKAPFFATVIQYTARLICIGAIVWAGLITADAVGSLSNFNTPIPENITEPLICSFPESLIPAHGFWTFADAEMSIEQVSCSEGELNRHTQEILSSKPLPMDAKQDASQLIAMAKSNGATQTECIAGTAWEIDTPSLRLCLLASKSKTPFLVAAAIAFADGDRWQLTKLTPKRSQSDRLLPLPADAQTCCTRQNDSGELQMELVNTSTSGEHLLRLWRKNGWRPQPSPWSTSESFSYLCVRGEEVVYAWSESLVGSRTLMLTSTNNALIKDTSAIAQKQK